MKKSLLALAALSTIAGVAQAQSSVTLYGTLDAGANYQTNTDTSGSGGWNVANSGFRQSNRVGFKGTEDIGGGLKANFMLETGINTTTGQDNGLSATNNQLFNRSSWLGLSNATTELRIGRDYTQNFKTIGAYDPFEYYYTTVVPLAQLLGTRFNNDFNLSHKIGNLTVGLEFAANGATANNYNELGAGIQGGAGTSATTTATNNAGTSAGNAYSASLKYDDSKLTLAAAYTQVNGDPTAYYTQATAGTVGTTASTSAVAAGSNGSGYIFQAIAATATNNQRAWTAGGAYNFGNVKVSAGYYNQQDAMNPQVVTYAWGGLKYAASPKIDVRAAYYQLNYTKGTDSSTGNTGLWIAAVDYKLSPRTTLYVEADQTNVGGNLVTSSGQTSYQRVGFGIGHTF